MSIAPPSDAAIAQLVNGIYAYPGFGNIAWDHLDLSDDQSFAPSWGLKRLGDVDCVIFRGSTTMPDWLRDAFAIADPFEHDFLGPVHPGFFRGLPAVLAKVMGMTGDNIVVAGHSLGAGEASIFSGLLYQAGRTPLRRVVFGEPRPGFSRLARIISRFPGASYRNGNGDHHDLVTDVPFSIGIEDYVHPTPLTDVCEVPGANWRKQWGIFAWHGMPLYLAALEREAGLPASGPAEIALAPGAPAPHLSIH